MQTPKEGTGCVASLGKFLRVFGNCLSEEIKIFQKNFYLEVLEIMLGGFRSVLIGYVLLAQMNLYSQRITVIEHKKK